MKKTKKIEETKVKKDMEKKAEKSVQKPAEKTAETKVTQVTKITKKSDQKQTKLVSHGVGRRKRAVARVWLRRGKGDIRVHGKDFKKYFDTDFNREEAHLTFNLMGVTNYDADVNVHGGGLNSQAGAIKLAIARALVEHNPNLRSEMKKWHLLSVDPRVKERKKYGQRGARRKFQFVKR